MARLTFCLWIAFVFVVVFVLVYATTFVDRRDYSHAVVDYVRNPTPENEARLQSERRKNEIAKTWDAAAGASLVTAVVLGMFALYRFVRKPNSD